MMSEKAICELLSDMLPQGRLNRCFDSDAEIIRVNGGQCLFTTDEFSAEDLFRESNPYVMGWNIAAGGISDIFACGGVPLYYAHALTVDERWDAEYVGQFGAGVRDVLNATGARFIGGDCGRSARWRCTVSVIGSCEGRPVVRRGAAPGDLVYLSGRIGAGNLEAGLTLQAARSPPWASALKNQFPPRLREAAIMKKYASSCIDTSDGVWAALTTLADLNGCGYAVADLPYLGGGVRFCQWAALPRLVLFLGECGEYELLFTMRPEHESSLLAEAEMSGCSFYRLGRITPAERVVREDGQVIDLGSLRIQARDYETPQRYFQNLTHWLEQHLPNSEGAHRI
jgi:thiamine-monophosphate kinase